MDSLRSLAYSKSKKKGNKKLERNFNFPFSVYIFQRWCTVTFVSILLGLAKEEKKFYIVPSAAFFHL